MTNRSDQLVACALWNLKEADVALEMSKDKRVSADDMQYYLRRHKRLLTQAQSLHLEALAANDQEAGIIR